MFSFIHLCLTFMNHKLGVSKRVPAPDFSRNCCPDTRPALCRVLPDTRVGYPAPDTTGTRPDPIFLKFFCFYLYLHYPRLVDSYISIVMLVFWCILKAYKRIHNH